MRSTVSILSQLKLTQNHFNIPAAVHIKSIRSRPSTASLKKCVLLRDDECLS